jgi:ribose 5-phosphate isomerase B
MNVHIAIGADHRGFILKKFLAAQKRIGDFSIEWDDVGTYNEERTDYPIFARKVVKLMQDEWVDVGIMACGTGIGMAIAANRFRGMYAGLVWNEEVARKAKEDDNINILVLPADFISLKEGYDIVLAWLNATFKGGRYQERLDILDELQRESCLSL